MTNLLAQIRNPVLPSTLGGGTSPNVNSGGAALGQLISNLIGALFIAGFLLATIELLLGGYGWITSGGEKQELEKARNKITNALIGIIVVAAVYAVTRLLASFFGLDITNLKVPGFGGN